MTPTEILEIELARQQTKKIDDVKNNINESNIDLCFLPNASLAVSCDKEKLCADSSIISMPQPMNKHDFVAPKPNTCAENKSFVPITSVHHELQLISSLNTLGYIEFDVLCNLNNLNEKLFMHDDLPWLSKHTCHVIGKYDSKGEYMVHRVYICSNLKSSYVGKQYDQLEGCTNTNYITSSSSCFSMFALKQQDQL
jgi:hypothetical protein